jgi:hypothetical protein
MHENISRPLRLHELADAAYLSPFHFDRVFHAATGVSAVAFALALRIDAAKRLIAIGEASVGVPCLGETLQPDPRAALGLLLGWECAGPGPMPDGGEYFVARLHGADVRHVLARRRHRNRCRERFTASAS